MPTSGLKKNSNYTIMLVDDEPQQLKFLKMVLKDAGYNVISTDGAKNALKMLKTTLPDVIISDLIMPGIDGIALCKKIYSNKYLKQIPIVIVTAIQDSFYYKQGIDAGAIDYIYKPIMPNKLLTKLHKILTRTLDNNRINVLFLCLDCNKIKADKSIFEDYNINIIAVDKINYALEMIHTYKTNLIISEIDLKSKTGFEFCSVIKNSVFKSIPFIILSNNISSTVFFEGAKFGVNDYWDSTLPTKGIIKKIKTFFNHTKASNSYPKFINGNLKDSSVIEISQILSTSMNSGILTLKNSTINGHIHFQNGQITDAFVSTYKGTEAFYILSLMDTNEGSFSFISTTDETENSIIDTPEKLFLNVAKLKDGICKVQDESIILNKTYSGEITEKHRIFVEKIDGSKTLKQIVLEMGIHIYHGFLLFEKLKNRGCILSPADEVLSMEQV